MIIGSDRIVAQRYMEEVIHQGKLELIGTFYAAEMRARVKTFLTAGDDPFPDGREEIKEIVAEGDMVTLRWNQLALQYITRVKHLISKTVGASIDKHNTQSPARETICT